MSDNPFAAHRAAVSPAPGAPQTFGAGAGGQAPPPQNGYPMGGYPQGGYPQQQYPQNFGAPAPTATSEVSLDDDVPTSTLDRFGKQQRNQISRLALVALKPEGSIRVHVAQQFKVGRFGDPNYARFSLPPGTPPEILREFVKRLGEPMQQFGTIVMNYNTDSYGNLIPGGERPFVFKSFIFNVEKWKNLKMLNGQWPLQNFDILSQCTDENFQRYQFQPCPDCLWRRAEESMQTAILAEATDLFEGPLTRRVGFSKTMEEIQYFLQFGSFPQQNTGRPGPQQHPGGFGGGAPMLSGPVPGQTPYNPFGGSSGPAPAPNPAPSGNPFGAGPSPAGATAASVARQAGVGSPETASMFVDALAGMPKSEPAPAAEQFPAQNAPVQNAPVQNATASPPNAGQVAAAQTEPAQPGSVQAGVQQGQILSPESRPPAGGVTFGEPA